MHPEHWEPEASGTEGLAEGRIVEAIYHYESARPGQFVLVSVPEFHNNLRPNLSQQLDRSSQPESKPVHGASRRGEAA
jgi:hypothetical protein